MLTNNMLTSRPSVYPLRHILFYIGAAILFAFIFAYVLYQARFIIIGPQITLTERPEVAQNTRVVDLAGQARNITNITLNGREIYTDENGYFKEAVVLENGYTIATLEATDRYGRTTELATPFVFTPMTRLP